MPHSSLARVAVAILLLASPLSAQSWQAIGVPGNSNSGAYWNNASDDNVANAVCNAGAIVTNTPALAAGSCNNQAPNPFLPLSPAPLTTANVFLGGAGGTNLGAFRFAAGSYSFTATRVAGDRSTSWGVILDNGTVFTAAQLASGRSVISGPFAIWVTQTLPAAGAGTIYTSTQSTGAVAIGSRTATVNQQFAVFTNARGAGSAGLTFDAFGAIIDPRGGVFYVGAEDNVNGGRGFGIAGPGRVSDRDYNDIIRFGHIPEPDTALMFGLGLVALALLPRGRRTAQR